MPLEDPPPVPSRLTPTHSNKTHSKIHASNSLPLSTLNNSFSVYSDPRNSNNVTQQYDYVNKTPEHNHDAHRQFEERSEPRRSTKRLVKVSNN